MSNLSRLLLSLTFFIFFLYLSEIGWGAVGVNTSCHLTSIFFFCFLQSLYQHFFLVITKSIAKTDDYVISRTLRRNVSNETSSKSRIYPKYDRGLEVVL